MCIFQVIVFNPSTAVWRVQRISADNLPDYNVIHDIGPTGHIVQDQLYLFSRSSWSVQFSFINLIFRVWSNIFYISTRDEEYIDRIDVLNLDTFEWEHCCPNGPHPWAAYRQSSWVHNEKIYIFGRILNTPNSRENQYATSETDDDGWSNQFAVYNVALNTWENPKLTGQIPKPRHEPATIVNRDDVYLYGGGNICLLYTSPSPRDLSTSRMPSSA